MHETMQAHMPTPQDNVMLRGAKFNAKGLVLGDRVEVSTVYHTISLSHHIVIEIVIEIVIQNLKNAMRFR